MTGRGKALDRADLEINRGPQNDVHARQALQQPHPADRTDALANANRVPWPDFARLAAKTGFPGTDVILGPAQQRGASATNDLLAHLNLKPAVLEFPVDFRKDEATFAAGLRDLPN